MKKIGLILLLLYVVTAMQAQLSKNVIVSPGTLSSSLTPEEIANVTDLVLAGSIDATDFATIHDMVLLENIDLSDLVVSTIPNSAFSNNSNLVTVKLPPSVTIINEFAFYNCKKLVSVNVPADVVIIGSSAFYECSANITVDASNAYYASENGVLFNKAKTKLIQCPISMMGDYSIPASVVEIDPNAFYDCNGLNSVTIPSSVTKIGYLAFSKCTNIKDIFFDGISSLSTIEYSAFQACSSLSSIALPSSVTSIGNSAFSQCTSLSIAHIPSGISTIADSLFQDCETLTSVALSIYITTIGGGAFENCKTLDIGIPKSVITIGDRAFYNCLSMTSVSLPSTTTTVGSRAFEGCSSVGLISISGYVSSIDPLSFYNCSGSFWVDVNNNYYSSINGVLYNKDQSKLLTCPTVYNGKFELPASVISVADYAFFNSTKITSFVVPKVIPVDLSANTSVFPIDLSSCVLFIPTGSLDAYKTVPQWSNFTLMSEPGDKKKTTVVNAGELKTTLSYFEKQTTTELVVTGTIDARDFVTMHDEMPLLRKIDLLAVHIKEYIGTEGSNYGVSQTYGADTIPKSALNNKLTLDTVLLPSTVTGIGESAFKGCEGLKYITLPNGINKIENDVFSSCISLTEITLPSSLIEIGTYSFLGCGFTTIDFPSTLTSIGFHAFEGSKITQLTFPNSLKTFDEGVFSSCNGLESVVIPSSISYVSQHLFYNCNNLSSVTLPNTITAINDYAFEYCLKLKSINLPVSVTAIGPYAFSGCTGLVTFQIPFKTKLNIIDNSAFSGCTSLVSIVIPENMTKIGLFAFAGCSSLSSVKVFDQIPYVFSPNDGVFQNVSSSCNLYIPKGTLLEYQGAEIWKNFISTQEFNYTKKTIVLNNAGELSTSLTSTELNYVTDLTISGFIDARDFKTMNQSMPNGNNIDLSDATIVGYSGPDGPSFGDNIYPANTIPEYSFSNNMILQNIILPNTATKIDQYAFRASKASIFIPASISDLGIGVFAESSVNITVDANNGKFIVEQEVLMNKDKTDLYYCSPTKSSYYSVPSTVKTIHEYSFYGCTDITEIFFPKGLIEIGNSAFYGCTGILNFNLPQSVEKIGAGAFSKCSMSTMVLPPKVSMLNWSLLQNCSNLYSVSLPLHATIYGSNMFSNSTSIQSLQVYNPVPVDLSLNQIVFDGIDVLTCMLVVPYTSLSNYQSAEVWKTFVNISERSGLSLLKKSISVDNDGGIDTIPFTSNSGWIVTKNANWINLISSNSGYGDSSVVVGLAPNTGADREDYIYFSVYGVLTDSVKITQKYECIPKPTVVGTSTVCFGDKVSLSVNSANKLEWFSDVTLYNKLATGVNPYDVTPTTNASIYVVESSSTNCSSPATKVDIFVNSLPTISIMVSPNDSITDGDLVTLSATSTTLIDTYTWDNGITNSIAFSPSTTQNYTVTATDFNACIATASINVDVKKVIDLQYGLVAYYPFNGTTADMSVSGNDASNNGASLTSDRFGNNNNAYQFDGISNSMSAQGFNVTGDWTLNAWYLADRTDYALQYVIGANYSTSWGNGLAVHGESPTCSWNNNIHLFYDGTGICDNSIAGGELTTNWWYHSVLVKSGNQYSLYSNNKLINSVIGTDIDITKLFLGMRADGYFYFNGKIDDIRLYNRAISVKEIDSLYHENGYVDPAQTVTVATGELSSKLSKDDKNGIIKLTLLGNIDARDFKTMRDSMPNLRYVDLSGTTIEAYSGQNGTNLPQIAGTLPDYMTFDENTIPLLAFKNKGLIDTILIPSSIVNIGNSAFSYCSNLNYIQLPAGLKNIDNYAFQFCKFSSITLPSTIESLGTNVFNSCAELVSITIPDNIVTISESMFAGCSKLETLNLHANITSINDYAFSNCENLQSITIPPSTITIGRFAFWNCKQLSAISFASTSKVQIIGEGAFTSCIGLTSFIAPTSLKTIQKTAFMDCYNLSTITIPENVSSIGDNAFWNCSNLSTINAMSLVPVYILPTAGVFNNVNVSTCTLLVQYGTKLKYDTASVWQNFIIKENPKPEKSVYISAGLLSTELSSVEKKTVVKLTISGTIDAQDFKTMRDSMPMLQEIDLSQAQIVDYSGTNGTGSGLVNYEANQVPIQAFVSKSTLVYVILPFSVNSIANAAFEYCNNLSYVDYPATLNSIGTEAFYGTKLFDIFKPSSVSVINQSTFKNCTELSMVAISSTVTYINSEAFANCSALKTLHVYAKVPPVLVSDAFSGVDKSTCKVYVPVGTLNAYKADAKWKTFFSIEEFDQSFAPYLINNSIPDQNAMNGAMFYPLDFKMYIGDNYTVYDKLKFTFEPNSTIGLTAMNGMFLPKQLDSSWTGSTKIKCTVTNEANLSMDFDIIFIQNNLLNPFASVKPTCNFSASKLYLKLNQSTKFYSQNKDALTIEWTFEGGTPATSTSISPSVTYDTTGVFSVTLKAVNIVGETIITKKSYIYVSALSVNDTTICNGDSVTISVLGSGYTSFSWNTTPVQTTSTIKVSPKTTTKYKVTMKKGLVSIVDSVTISLAKKPDLGNDTTFCEGSSIQISPGTFAKYYWNDAITEGNASLLISKSGSYSVTIIDAQGCIASDLILVNPLYSKPTVNIGKDSTFCWKKKLTIDAGSFNKYMWSTGNTTQTIIADTTAFYSVTVTDNHSCTNADTVAVKVIVPIIPDIAVVTLSSTNKNIVAWEPMNSKGIKLYHIWKENTSSVFEVIKTINKTDSTYYIDKSSNPIASSNRYALSTVDSACGNESYLSKIHRTMHLSCKYDGKKVTTTWNNYEGLNITKYQIYRAETGKQLQLYATVDASAGIETSWDDFKPIGLNSYYQVQFDLEKEITPSALKSDSGPFSVSLSNMAESELVGVDIESKGNVLVYPNPAQTRFTVSLPTQSKFSVTVLDVLSQAVKCQSGVEKISIDCSDLQAGMYLLKIVAGDEVSSQSIMIVH